MLWSLAAVGSTVGWGLGYALFIAGVATCVWLPLSYVKPLGKKSFGAIACAVALAVAAVKVTTGPRPQAAEASPPPAAAPAAQSIDVAATTQPVNAAPAVKLPTTRPAHSDNEMGDRYTDNTNGYSIQFPKGWASRQFAAGNPWFLDVSDGKTGMISIGFSPFPSSAGLDQLKPLGLQSHLKFQSHVTVTKYGYSEIDGKRCIWMLYTGPVETATGKQKMTAVHYYLPLHDGRMLELRLAALPEQFAKVSPMLKKSVATMKLLPL